MRRLPFPHDGNTDKRLDLGFVFSLSKPLGTPTRAAQGGLSVFLRHSRFLLPGVPLALPFPQNELALPWGKARVILHNSMEGSGNEFGKELGSVHRRVMGREGICHESSSSQLCQFIRTRFAVNLSVSYTVTATRKTFKRALILRVAVLPSGGIYVSVCSTSPSPLISQNGFRPLRPQVSV